MKKVCRRFRILGILLGIMLFAAAGSTFHGTTVQVQAATTNGFRTVGGKTYYYQNGKMVKGWKTIGGKKYFFNLNTGVMRKGWKQRVGAGKSYLSTSTGAMLTGFQKIKGKYYYFDPKTGISKSGFLKFSNGKYRYFMPKTFEMATGWMQDSSNHKYYFGPSDGYMYTGWQKIGKYYYLFNKKTGIAFRGFSKGSNGLTRYFRQNYKMATGWLTETPSRRKRYFSSRGIMYTGLKTVSGKKYYFDPDSGLTTKGFVTISGNKYYFDTATYIMVTGKTITVNGIEYTFNSSGVLTNTYDPSTSADAFKNDPRPIAQTSAKTIKNYLAGAMKPVGQALYVWGGGWTDSTRKGVSPTWQKWYTSQNSSYNYNNYRDLTTANRIKGLDCSGFVGWTAYQVMHTTSGVGGGYTVVSGDIGSYYKSLGWGSILNQNYLSGKGWKMQPGDVGYDGGHTWIVVGQCSDKSAVIVHSTPQAGCQLAGTTTPDGNYDSQAVALAKKYMSRYAGYSKYEYHPSCGNYIRRGNYLRWNTKTLSDPDGFKKMTADQILKVLFP